MVQLVTPLKSWIRGRWSRGYGWYWVAWVLILRIAFFSSSVSCNENGGLYTMLDSCMVHVQKGVALVMLAIDDNVADSCGAMGGVGSRE